MDNSTSPSAQPAEAAVKKVGDLLRQARIDQNLQHDEISKNLCIRTVHLRAIEDGNFKELPALVYARGFVKSYAEYLKLDSNFILSHFQTETADQNLDPDFHYNAPTPVEKYRPTKSAVMAGIAAFVFLIAVWNILTTEQVSETVSLPQEQSLEAADQIPPADEYPASSTPPSASSFPLQQEPASSVTLTGPLDPMPQAQNQQPVAPIAGSVQTDPVSSAPAAVLVAPALVLEATQDVWVEIKDANYTILFSRVLRSGENYTVPASYHKTAKLLTANGGGLRVKSGGTVLGVLGNPGEVVNGISLDPQEITRHIR